MLETEAGQDEDQLLRLARRRLREKGALPKETAKELRSLAEALARVRRVGSFAFVGRSITQEELAEHLKRIRHDYCAGSLRDTLNRFLPQPAGPRRAYIRVPQPLAIDESSASVDNALEALRSRMQIALDAINVELEARGTFRRYANPFNHAHISCSAIEAT